MPVADMSIPMPKLATRSIILMSFFLVTTAVEAGPAPAANDTPLEGQLRFLVENTQAKLLNRRYEELLSFLDDFQRTHPKLPFGYLGKMLTYQTWMLETIDLEFEKPYLETFEQAEKLAKKLDVESYSKKDRAKLFAFIGGIYGIHGMYEFRKRHAVRTLRYGWLGIDFMKKAIALDPTFVDAYLGIGLYEFWRSIVQERFKVGWLFSDTKEEGIKKITLAVEKGLYTKMASLFGLGLIYLETEDTDKLLAITAAIKKTYPQNILVDFMDAFAALRKKDRPKALRHIEAVLKITPDNDKALFFKYAITLGDPKNTKAKEFFLALTKRVSQPFYLAYAYYCLGQIEAQRSPKEAAVYFKRALDVEPALEGARQALKEIETPKKRETK